MLRRNRGVAAPTPVHAAVADLTTRLVGRLAAPDTNLACSGLGLWCALAVLASGASGATADELGALLGLAADEDPADRLGRLDDEVTALAGTAHALAVWSRVPTYRAWREGLPAASRSTRWRWCATGPCLWPGRWPTPRPGAPPPTRQAC